MICISCKKCIESEKYCDSCLSRLIEKRIQKALRGTISQEDKTILVVNDGFVGGVVLEYFIKKMIGKARWTITVTKTVREDYDKVFLPLVLEEYVSSSLTTLFTEGVLNIAKEKIHHILREISLQDCEILATQRGLSFKKKKTNLFSPLKDLEQKHPGSVLNIAKSLKDLQ